MRVLIREKVPMRIQQNFVSLFLAKSVRLIEIDAISLGFATIQASVTPVDCPVV